MAEGAVDTKMVSESAVLDAMLLRDCDFFVGRCVTIARAPLPVCLISCAAPTALQLHKSLLPAGAGADDGEDGLRSSLRQHRQAVRHARRKHAKPAERGHRLESGAAAGGCCSPMIADIR